MSTPIEKFVHRLINVFGEPKARDVAGYIDELQIHLGRYSSEELQEAATRLMQTSKYRTWPLPAEMIEAAEAARNDLLLKAREGLPSRAEPDDFDPFSKQSKAAAYRLIRSDMGREAALQGWIGQLFIFCCKHRRLPTGRERVDLVQAAARFDELYAKTCRDLEAAASVKAMPRQSVGHWQPIGGLDARLLRTGLNGMEHFMRERARLAEIANGGGSA